jgi:integrase
MSEPKRRQRRKVLTDKMVAALSRKRNRYILADPEQRGHYVRVPPQGPCVFAAVARSPYGKQVWATLGTADVLAIEQAREAAREAIKRIKQGLPAFAPPPVKPDTVADVCTGWLKRHVEAKQLRTSGEQRRILEKYVLPHWRDRPFMEIKRSDVAALLDHVEDRHGAWTADAVLTVLRSVASWHSARDDGYVPPFTKGMRRVPAQSRARSRVLDDAELRAVWRAAEEAGVFGAFVMLLLLTGQRREKVVTIKWDAVSEDGTWTIPTEPREKGNPGVLRLSPAAMKVLKAQPRLAGNPYVFPGRSDGPLAGFSERHAAFKARCGVDGWTLHDCRRTARSLLSRTNVRPDIAERVLGHTVGGSVAGIYDRHHYHDEMADALKRLARLITQIVNGEGGKNVVPLRAPALQP